jgi:hypothetical protein
MHKLALPAVAAALMAFGATQVLAQSATQAPTKTPTKTPARRSATSLECSRQADVKNLHGKVRRHFRSTCMRGMAKGKTPTQNPLGYR